MDELDSLKCKECEGIGQIPDMIGKLNHGDIANVKCYHCNGTGIEPKIGFGEFEYVLSKHFDDTCGAFDEINSAHNADMQALRNENDELKNKLLSLFRR